MELKKNLLFLKSRNARSNPFRKNAFIMKFIDDLLPFYFVIRDGALNFILLTYKQKIVNSYNISCILLVKKV